MEATAKYEYTAKQRDELSIQKGEKLIIFPKESDSSWITAESLDTNAKGQVPANFIEIKPHDFFQSSINRLMAENALLDTTKRIGSFLVRLSSGECPGFSVSVKSDNRKVQHFKVARNAAGFSIWNEMKFRSINQLVDYYRHHQISRDYPVRLSNNSESHQRESNNRSNSRRPSNNQYVRMPDVPASNPSEYSNRNPRDTSTTQSPSYRMQPTAPPLLPKYRALYDHEADPYDNDSILSFSAGDLMELLASHESGWSEVRLGRLEGFVPSAYIQELDH